MYQRPDSSSDDSNIASLVDLSCHKIVQHSRGTREALKSMPPELFYNLMKAALMDMRDRTIEVLIAEWPFPVLALSRFAPPLFEKLEVLYSERYLGERMRRGVNYTTCLAHTFVECLKKRSPTRLRCLDLTGFPAGTTLKPSQFSYKMKKKRL